MTILEETLINNKKKKNCFELAMCVLLSSAKLDKNQEKSVIEKDMYLTKIVKKNLRISKNGLCIYFNKLVWPKAKCLAKAYDNKNAINVILPYKAVHVINNSKGWDCYIR